MKFQIAKWAKIYTQTWFAYVLLVGLIFLLVISSVRAEDWPTYMHDNARSGVTGESLDLLDLDNLAWVYVAPTPPQRAWSNGPPWDAWSRKGAVPMRDFDAAIFVTVANDEVYLGSSVTNSVHCLDAFTGQQKWFYHTNGPVRFPPSYYNGKLYFGSDDGNAYCINVADGSFVWKYNPSGDKRQICNNGRLVTMWPIRTGTAVLDDKVYFAASLVPWRSSYLCSVDSISGSTGGSGLYNVYGGKTPTGLILVSDTNIYLPQGRFYPQIFSRSTGSSGGSISGSTGVYALLTSDGPSTGFVYGPGRAWDAHGYLLSAQSDKLASHPDGKYMVVSGGYSYVVTETFAVESTKGYRKDTVTTLKAIDRDTAGTTWSVTCEKSYYSLIYAGDILFAGGTGMVYAHSTTDGSVLWSQPVNGHARGLAAADGQLYVSTDTGYVYAFGTSYLPEDFNKDGIVDLVDLMMFIDTFLDCTDPTNPYNCFDVSGTQ